MRGEAIMIAAFAALLGCSTAKDNKLVPPGAEVVLPDTALEMGTEGGDGRCDAVAPDTREVAAADIGLSDLPVDIPDSPGADVAGDTGAELAPGDDVEPTDETVAELPAPPYEWCEVTDAAPLLAAPGATVPGLGAVRWVQVLPAGPDTVYYVAMGTKLHRSADDGATWEVLSVDYAAYNNVGPMAIDPNQTDTLYLALFNYGTTSLHKSQDGGENWSELPFPGDVIINSVAIDPAEPHRLWIGTHWDGVYRSLDGGANWEPTGLTEGIVLSLEVDPDDTDRLYAGTWGNDGLYRTTDGGDTWTSDGAPGNSLQDVTIDVARPGFVYAITYGGINNDTVYRTEDYGDSWEELLHSSQAGNLQFFGILPDPCDSDRIYIASENGVVLSTDAGESWSHITDGFTATGGGVVLYNVTRGPGRILAGSESCGLYSSADLGMSWQHLFLDVCENAPDIDF